MARTGTPDLGVVETLRRYPVKSMLGEELDDVVVEASGLRGDRHFALIDTVSGRVASAKHPKAWRALLTFSSRWDDGRAVMTLPDGTTLTTDTSDADGVLSRLLGRDVAITASRPEHASVARPAPEDVIAEGEDADVPYELLEIGQGTVASTFVDYAGVHLVAATTLAEVGAEMVRYRPNIVLSTPDCEPFAENGWVGGELSIGTVRLRVTIPTPRCAVPTLAHGKLPRSPEAVKRLLTGNRVDVPGFGVLPSLGVYAEVIEGGILAVGDRAKLSESPEASLAV